MFIFLGSSALPVNVNLNAVSPNIISAQWDILKACATSTNYTMFKYVVNYKSIEAVETLNETGEVNITRVKVFMKGLIPYKSYSIQIAVLDKDGFVGPFTDPVTLGTPEDG